MSSFILGPRALTPVIPATAPVAAQGPFVASASALRRPTPYSSYTVPLAFAGRIAVLGTGTMGPGIAALFARAGVPVTLYGRSTESALRGFDRVLDSLNVYLSYGVITQAQYDRARELVFVTDDLKEAVQDSAFVLETIHEDLADKQILFSGIETFAPRSAIIASNTSGLSITEIASVLDDLSRAVVAHFWNPPHLIPLVEILGVEKNSEAVTLTDRLMRSIGKRTVVMQKEILGHVGNRLQFALLREALYLVETGVVSAEELDRIVEHGPGVYLGSIGPFAATEMSQLHAVIEDAKRLAPSLCNSKEPSSILRKAIEAGRRGVKTEGRGIYDWQPDSIPVVTALRDRRLVDMLKVDEQAPSSPFASRPTMLRALSGQPDVLKNEAEAVVLKRLRLALLREALGIVTEDVVTREQLDLIVTSSFGRRLGIMGPLTTADFGGLDTFLRISGYLNPSLSNDNDLFEIL